MTTDALDPGPNGDYPYWPRDSSAGTRMPTGVEQQRTPDGRTVNVDLTKTDANGQPIQPPGWDPTDQG